MTSADDERKRRVRAVLAAASRLADPVDPMGREARAALPAETGLSPEGVELGLARHLETCVSDGDLARLVARARPAPHVHVVLSANVFVGAVRALAVAVAAAPRVSVRSSRREAVMAPLLARALSEQPGASDVQLVDTVDAKPGDEVHVYGRRESIDAVAAGLPAGVRVRGHGPGIGIAVVDADDAPDGWTDPAVAGAAESISWDVVPFDQRGCLSPRIVIVHGSPALGEAVSRGLAARLAIRGREVPRGRLDDDERGASTLYCETMRAVGTCIDGDSFAVGFDPDPSRLLLPPSGRHVHVACVSVREKIGLLLEPYRTVITAIGASGRRAAVGEAVRLAPRARISLLGEMQHPPLDGPVDLRDVE